MNRQKKQLMILCLLLLLLLAAYIGMRYYNDRHTKGTETVTYPVTQTALASITGFSFTNETGSYTFEKKENKWYCLEDKSMDIDTVTIENMIETAASIEGQDQITGVSDMSQYGLTNPEITVTITTAEGKTVLYIGDYNSTVYRYYVCLEGSDSVYTIDSTVRNSFTGSSQDLKTIKTGEEGSEK